MIIALLGDIRIGDGVWTGPTAANETAKATLVEQKVARGKPPIQDMGDENMVKTLAFFFDETFCSPGAELSKLKRAFRARTPLAYVGGDGAYAGIRWLLEAVTVETLRSTPHGRPTRLKVEVSLRECPGLSPLTFFAAIARDAAAALSTIASGNVTVKK